MKLDLLAGHSFHIEAHTVAAGYAAWLLRTYGAETTVASALDPEGIGAYFTPGAATLANGEGIRPPNTVLVTDAAVSTATRDRLERLAETAPVIWITPWGLESPLAEAPWSELTLEAAGGWLHAVGDPDREPLGTPGPQVLLAAGLFATIAAIAPLSAGLDAAPPPDRGLTVISMAEAALATTIYDAVSFQYHGVVRQRVSNRFAATQPTLVTLPCKDGHFGLHAALHRQWLRLIELVGHPELASDERFASPLARAANIADLDAYLVPWFAERTRFETYHALEEAGIPASPHPTLAEVLASPQLAARNSWETIPTPSGKSYRMPGPPARVKAEQAGGGPRSDGPWEPGRLRVLDFGMGWAGPLVSHVMACFGADVIKVESHVYFDWWRGSRPPGDDPGLVLFERSHAFNAVNRGKRGVTLDLRTEPGRDLAIDLAGTADVVVENYAAGVMEKFGLDYASLSARNPGLIMLRQPAFGAEGPESGYLAFGNTIEGLSGLTALMGYPDGPPMMLSSALGDPINGLNGAISVLAGLAAHRRDGHGRCIEAAQLEGFLPMISVELLEYQRSGELPARRANARISDAPCAAFPCLGEDAWVAIHVQSDAQWNALAKLINQPWIDTPNLATAAGRVAGRKGLERAIANWTRQHDRDELTATLVAAGIPAAPVNSEADCLSAEPFLTGEFFQAMDRAVVGTHLYPGLAFRAGDGGRFTADRPAPTLGQHNDEVFRGLGLSSERLEELRAAAIIGERPN